LKEKNHFKIEHIVIGILSLIIAALIVSNVVFTQRKYMLEQELTAAQQLIHEMLLEAEEPTDPIHYRVIQHILDVAPERLRRVFDENVELNEPESFVILPNDRIWVSGQWVCHHFGMTYTIEAIFSFWVQNNEIWLELLSYSPFGYRRWRDPYESPNSHSWVRYHELEIVPVRFYGMGGEWHEVWYDVEYLSGAAFSEELAYHALKRLNRRIVDAWFVGRILYVNLHHSEPMAMSSGTFGELVMYSTLVSSMASVPGIDALVILVDGRREAEIGGHGLPFKDIYLVNPRLCSPNLICQSSPQRTNGNE